MSGRLLHVGPTLRNRSTLWNVAARGMMTPRERCQRPPHLGARPTGAPKARPAARSCPWWSTTGRRAGRRFRFEDLFEGPEALRRYWPRFDFELLDLPEKDAEDIVGEVKVRIALLALRAMWRPGSLAELIEIAALIGRIDEKSTATGVLQALIHYTFRARESLTQEEIQRAAEAALPDLGGITVATLAEKLHQEGRREGLLEGLRTSLVVRFGAEGLALMPRFDDVEDVDRLAQLLALLPKAEDLAELRAALD